MFWVNGLTWMGSGGSGLEPVCLEKSMREIKKRNGVIFKGQCCGVLIHGYNETKKGYFQK